MKPSPPTTFRDSEYPDAAKAYAKGELNDAAWDKLMKRPLFRVWLRGVLRHHFADCCGVPTPAGEIAP